MDFVTITLANRDGAQYRVDPSRPLLNTLGDEGVSLPYGCRYGGCITCAAKLLDGWVQQERAVALDPRQLRLGYILLCVATPMGDCTLEVGVDSHDRLYRNPFAHPVDPAPVDPAIGGRMEDR